MRSSELRTAASGLGVNDLRFLCLVDPEPVDGLAQAPAVADAELAASLDRQSYRAWLD